MIGTEHSRNGSVIIFVMVLMAAAMILTAASMQSAHGTARRLVRLNDAAIARETAAAGLERARALIHGADQTALERWQNEGLTLEDENGTVVVSYRDDLGAYEMEATGRHGQQQETIRTRWHR